jgi:hypothetical protein
VKAGAHVIVTANLKDFYDLPDGIEAQSPMISSATSSTSILSACAISSASRLPS